MLRNQLRTFSTSARRLSPANLNKNSVFGERKAESASSNSVTPQRVEYNPKVFTQETEGSNNRPLPVNVEANYWAPMKHKPKYNDKVAELQLRSYDAQLVEFYGDFIIRAAYYLNIPVSGTIPLPKRRERWTVIKAPFVHAKTKENYQRITHKRLIKAYDATPQVIDLWVSFIRKHSPAGLGIKVQSYQRQSLDFLEELEVVDPAQITESVNQQEFTTSNDVKARVQELLNDPVFKQHMTPNDLQIENEPTKKVEATKETQKKRK